MSWDRDEAGSLLELMGSLTERMSELHDTFTAIREQFREDGQSSPRGDSKAFDIDVDAVTEFTQAIREATPQVTGLGKEFDSLADKIGTILREQTNVNTAGQLPSQQTSDLPVPINARPAVYDNAPASYYSPPSSSPAKPNLDNGMFSPIKTAAQADKWLFDKLVAEHGLGQGASKYIEQTTPSGDDLLALINAGVPMNMAGKFAQQRMSQNILQVAQQATAVPVIPKPPKPLRVPKVPKYTWKHRVARGVFLGGTTGGLRGAMRGAITGAGLNLFTNPVAVGAALALAMPKIMSLTADTVERQLDTNRPFAAFAPATTFALAQYDVNTLFRNMELAQATSGTAVNLIRQQDATRQAMQPYEIATQNLANTGGTFLSAVTGRFFQKSAGVWNDINEWTTSEEVQSGASKLGKELTDTAVGAASWGAAAWLLSIFIPPAAPFVAAAAFAGGVYGLTSNLDEPSTELKPLPARHPLDHFNVGNAPPPRAF